MKRDRLGHWYTKHRLLWDSHFNQTSASCSNLLENQLATKAENGHMVFSSALQTEMLKDLTVCIEPHTHIDIL